MSQKTGNPEAPSSEFEEAERKTKRDARRALEDLLHCPEIIKFQKTLKILSKLFFKKNFLISDFGLSEVERGLIKAIVLKKFNPKIKIEFNPKCFNRIARRNLFKQNEDAVKFIFKRALKWLKNEFKMKVLSPRQRVGIKLQELSRLFYVHHFQAHFARLKVGAACSAEPCALKSFFEAKVTKKFLRTLTVNPEFIRSVEFYLRRVFLEDFRVFGFKKLKTLLKNWERQFQRMPDADAFEAIVDQINSRGNKIPWTLTEAQNGLRHVVKVFEGFRPNV